MQAWKRSDGRYTLIFGEPGNGFRKRKHLRKLGAIYDEDGNEWSVTEEQARLFGAEKVLGVITGPSLCGCEPAMFRWVGEREVARGNTYAKRCPDCTNPATSVPEIHSCDIIEVLGEPDVARQVYEAEFQDNIEALS